MADEVSSTNSYGKRPLWQWIAIYAVIAVVLYGAFYYFFLSKKGGYQQQAPSVYSTPAQPAQKSNETMETMKVTVVGTDFSFTPSTITAKTGQKVEITFKNEGQYPHNITITGVAKSNTVQSGQEDTFSFTADKSGSYPFSCTVDSHAEKGMTGTLTVE